MVDVMKSAIDTAARMAAVRVAARRLVDAVSAWARIRNWRMVFSTAVGSDPVRPADLRVRIVTTCGGRSRAHTAAIDASTRANTIEPIRGPVSR